MSHKSRKIAGLIESFETGEFDPHYLGFFDCFNRQLFFEAHEVLEELWLGQRGRPKDLFYKGLIQLAGAFVHVQKRRRQPALALLKLARANLVRFPTPFDGLELLEVLQLIDSWSGCLEAHPHLDKNLAPNPWPRLEIR